MIDKKIKIGKAKGRPMLNWVGKRPLDFVKGFPAQLVEIFDPSKTGQKTEIPTYENLKTNWQNLLFHGDNKEVLATLLENGFRGKIDLIYIDPPFNTGVDYIRRVQLRGLKTEKLEGEDYSLQEQTMYFNNFADDTYLQFLYERIQLLKELLSETGSIFVRMDYHFGHYVKCVLDEIFGKETFVNEILANRTKKIFEGVRGLNVAFDSIFVYTKDTKTKLNNIYKERKEIKWLSMHSPGIRHPRERKIFGKIFIPPTGRHWTFTQERIEKDLLPQNRIRISPKDPEILEYLQSKNELLDTNWSDIPGYSSNGKGYPTENSEQLLQRVIKMGSDSIILDCFIGSGTTAAVAQKLNRRWIGADINKGAIQTTSKRLQKIILEQMKKESCKCPVFAHYKVNDYDLKLLRTEAIELACQHIGIQRIKTDLFFDGTLGNNLVKIIEFNHPLTLLDLQLVEDELKKRPDEDRDITIVCLGKELSVEPWIEEWNKKHPVNKLNVIELRTNRKYGKFLIHKPAEAEIEIKRIKENKAKIKMKNFISPAIIERLNSSDSLVKVKISDFRSMIDCVLIDSNHDGKTFHIINSDVPEKKNDLIKGEYETEISKEKTIVAIKIIDMLGEEILVSKEV